jgi:hypothetical protein
MKFCYALQLADFNPPKWELREVYGLRYYPRPGITATAQQEERDRRESFLIALIDGVNVQAGGKYASFEQTKEEYEQWRVSYLCI